MGVLGDVLSLAICFGAYALFYGLLRVFDKA